MTGEARNRSELEEKEIRPRDRATRIFLALTIGACLVAAATGIYGAYNFPDAPIRQVEGGYVGKGGKPHTPEDFKAFILWEKAMFITFPLAFVLGFAFAITDSRRRRRSS
jgi:hypothetical protein